MQALLRQYLQWNPLLSSHLEPADVLAAMKSNKISVRLCLSAEDRQGTHAHHLYKQEGLNYWHKKGLYFLCWFNKDARMFSILGGLCLSQNLSDIILGILDAVWRFSDWFCISLVSTGLKWLGIWLELKKVGKTMLNTDVMMCPAVSERRSNVTKSKKVMNSIPKNLRGGGFKVRTTAAAHVQVWLKWWCELLHLQTSSQ